MIWGCIWFRGDFRWFGDHPGIRKVWFGNHFRLNEGQGVWGAKPSGKARRFGGAARPFNVKTFTKTNVITQHVIFFKTLFPYGSRDDVNIVLVLNVLESGCDLRIGLRVRHTSAFICMCEFVISLCESRKWLPVRPSFHTNQKYIFYGNRTEWSNVRIQAHNFSIRRFKMIPYHFLEAKNLQDNRQQCNPEGLLRYYWGFAKGTNLRLGN